MEQARYQIRRVLCDGIKLGSVLVLVYGDENMEVIWPRFRKPQNLEKVEVASHDALEDWVLLNRTHLTAGTFEPDWHESHKHPPIVIRRQGMQP